MFAVTVFTSPTEVDIVDVNTPDFVQLTVAPLRTLLYWSLAVSVMVDELPAVTERGDASMLDCALVAAPVENVTVDVVSPMLAKVAVTVTVPGAELERMTVA